MVEKVDLSIVIPCYNEKKNIPPIIGRFIEVYRREEKFLVELILVDNGSSDGSDSLLASYVRAHACLRTVRVQKNIGYGHGIFSGIKEARGEFICWTHADMQTDINDCIVAYNLVKGQKSPESCFVKGNRKGRPMADDFFTVGMSIFVTLLLGTGLKDINAQPNLFHRSFLKHTPKPPDDFSFDLYMYYVAKTEKFDVVRFAVEFKPRLHGESHWNTGFRQKMRFIERTVDYTVKLKKELKKDKP